MTKHRQNQPRLVHGAIAAPDARQLRGRWRRWLSALLPGSALVSVGLASSGAMAQIVPAGTDFSNAFTGASTTPPQNGAYGLGGPGIYVSILEQLTYAFEIDGLGNTLTLTNGAYFGCIDPTLTLTISDITITGGSEYAIWAANSLTLNTSGTVTFSNNSTPAGNGGGAIYSGAATTINGSITLSDNASDGGGNGGGIYTGGVLTINGSVSADGNTASAEGGAFFSNGAANLATTSGDGNVSLTHNQAQSGGAVYSNGNVSIGNPGGTVTIGVDGSGNAAGNSANAGGAIYSGGTTTLTGTAITLSNNTAAFGSVYVYAAGTGGAIFSVNSVTVNGALTMNNNQAENSGGGIFSLNGYITVNGSVSADGNSAVGNEGGAFFSGGAVNLATASGDGNVSLTNNTVAAGGTPAERLGPTAMSRSATPVELSRSAWMVLAMRRAIRPRLAAPYTPAARRRSRARRSLCRITQPNGPAAAYIRTEPSRSTAR